MKRKKKNFVADKLNQNIGKPKELWKSLKSLGLPSKQMSSSSLCLEKDENLSFDRKTNRNFQRLLFESGEQLSQKTHESSKQIWKGNHQNVLPAA